MFAIYAQFGACFHVSKMYGVRGQLFAEKDVDDVVGFHLAGSMVFPSELATYRKRARLKDAQNGEG